MQYILSVTEINRYIKEVISRDLILSNLWVRGEISNYKNHYSGHMYFTVKDDNSLLKCVMFRTNNMGLKFVPENGMKVIIKGYVSVFERDGQYQLYAEEMQPDGIGSLHIAFEQLKRKLEAEGLFDAVHKKKLPLLPGSIGVVTSSTGAVIRDIIHVLGRRFNNVNIKVFPVAVQGELAARQIARAIRKLNEMNCVDVIIIARGGGSLEELWAFNEEIVARSIFESVIPVISAVGHETDHTIADFVADLRAPTPSAAAEIVMPEKASLTEKIAAMKKRLKSGLAKQIYVGRVRLERVQNSTPFRQPFDRVYQERMRVDVLSRYLLKEMNIRKKNDESRLQLLMGKLEALSPLKILTRGYSVVKSKENGIILKSTEGIHCGDVLEIEMKDGKLDCIVKDIEVRRL